MRKVPLAESLRIIGLGSKNWYTGRPLVVSFEVTDSCTCYCKHCDHGGPRDTSRDMKPQDYRRYMDVLRPAVVQVSGGEPLMRGDLPEVIRNIKSDDGLPFIILVSNWSHMTFLITFISVIVAALICLPDKSTGMNVFIAALAASLVMASENIINDIFDIEIDKINRPERPLPSGKISSKKALVPYFIFLILSLIFTWVINLPSFLIVAVTTLILYLYSKIFKRILLVGNIVVAFLTGLVFIYGGFVVDNPRVAIVPALFAFLINLIREIVKDMEDVDGDKKANVITFPIKYGFQRSKILILIITIFLVLSTLYPFLTHRSAAATPSTTPRSAGASSTG